MNGELAETMQGTASYMLKEFKLCREKGTSAVINIRVRWGVRFIRLVVISDVVVADWL